MDGGLEVWELVCQKCGAVLTVECPPNDESEAFMILLTWNERCKVCGNESFTRRRIGSATE